MISTKLHGIIDYLVGAILVSAPYVLGFASNGRAQYVTMGLGVFAVLCSLSTDYEYGVIRLLSFQSHLVLDIVFAVVPAAAPWVLGFSDLIWWPHGLFGVAALVVVALSVKPARLNHDIVAPSGPGV